MAHHTIKQRLAAGLLACGYTAYEARTRRDCYQQAPGKNAPNAQSIFIFLGDAGSCRFMWGMQPAVTKSRPLAETMKKKLLAAGDEALAQKVLRAHAAKPDSDAMLRDLEGL